MVDASTVATDVPHAASRPEDKLIFVVDDEPGIRNALTRTLERGGYTVEGFLDLAGLVSGLQRSRPFFIVLDVTLQGSDAVEVLQALSDAGFDGGVQLLSGSSSSLLGDIRLVGERRRLRMLPVLSKPCRMQAIRAVADAEARARAQPHDTPHQSRTFDDKPLRIDLGDALRCRQVEVWYQPKFEIGTGQLVGAECLARVRRHNGEVALPGSFLPGASPVDLEQLAEFVLRRALSDWTDFAAAGLPFRPSINVSGRILSNYPLAAILRECVPVTKDWTGLILELTEEDALANVERAHEAATQLMIYGVELSIDDFGLGYSSLSRLRDIPFREIKLDRSFVQGCSRDKKHASLCKAVVELAHSLHASVVAEGIEDEEDFSCLRDLGCDVAQGFYLARPMPKDALVSWVRSHDIRSLVA